MPTMLLPSDREVEPVIQSFGVRKNVGFVNEELLTENKNSCMKNDSETSSSIGKNSDLSENSLEKSGEGEEVQSPFKGPLDAMDALELVLPMRRGISKFYNGKSKSFATLGEASSTKELSKPENAYTRRRRNLLASRSTRKGSGFGKTTLALAVAIVSDRKAAFSSAKSYSLADLQHSIAMN